MIGATYILNSPVLTAYGVWAFHGPLGIEAARDIVKGGFISAVGHESTAALLTELLGQPIRMQRIRADLQKGDRALVLYLQDRQAEGALLTAQDLQNRSYELALLERIE